MLKKALLALGAIVLLFIATPIFLPANFRVERSAQIDAPASVVYDQVNILKNWNNWSPWNKYSDPTLEIYFEGPPAGVGATRRFKSEHSGGNGSITIRVAEPNKKVEYELTMQDGFTAGGTITLNESAGVTDVSWAFFGELDYFMRYFNLLKSQMNDTFDEGLLRLKSISEKKAATP